MANFGGQSCRLCLLEDIHMVPLHNTDDDKVRQLIATIEGILLFQLTSVSISDVDIPNGICSICIQFVASVEDFRHRAAENQKRIMSAMANRHTQLEIKEEEQEAEIVLVKADPFLNDSVDEEQPSCDNNDSHSEGPRKRRSTRTRGLKSKDDSREAVLNMRVDDSPSPIAKKRTSRSKEAMNKAINSHITMTCDLCEAKDVYPDLASLFKHFKTIHSAPGYVRCCEGRFYKRNRLYDHVQRHVNPEAHKCDVCHKSMSSLGRLKIHQELHAADDSKTFQCAQCPKKFVNQRRLAMHAIVHTAEADKLPCDQCEKKFPSTKQLKIHVKCVHERTRPFVCEVCAKSYYSVNEMKMHQSSEHGGSRVRCDHCGVLYKNKYILRVHMRRVMDQRNDYSCDECDHQAKNFIALRAHKSKQHRKNMVMHKCTVCDKEFKRPGALQEHMATHTGEKPYSCLFCPKKYASSGNKAAHQKKRHPVEYQQWSNLRLRGDPNMNEFEKL